MALRAINNKLNQRKKNMKIKQAIRNGTMALAILALPSVANAGWQNATATYKTDKTSTVKLQRGPENSYGFLNINGSQNLDFETVYGEARVRKSLGRGFSLGAEYNGGTDLKDVVRPHLSYSRSVGPVFLDLKYSPIESSQEKGSQFGIFASTKLGNLGIDGWIDVDFNEGKAIPCGELEASYQAGKDISVVVRGEKYPWQKVPEFSAGLKFNL
jgi:hypothetical protein